MSASGTPRCVCCHLRYPARLPYCVRKLTKLQILTPIARYGIETGGPGHTAFKKLKVLLDRMMLRRTKLERADDLGLPPRTIVVRRDYFSPEEKELYMSLFTNAKRTFATYVGQGTVLNSELLHSVPRDLKFQLTRSRLLQHFQSHHPDETDGVSPRLGAQEQDEFAQNAGRF